MSSQAQAVGTLIIEPSGKLSFKGYFTGSRMTPPVQFVATFTQAIPKKIVDDHAWLSSETVAAGEINGEHTFTARLGLDLLIVLDNAITIHGVSDLFFPSYISGKGNGCTGDACPH